MISIPLNFRTPEQAEFFGITKRNSCFSGGFGNGKTYAGCQKILYLSSTFSNYRAAIVRFEESKLRETTMKTFYKLCPPALYDSKFGGNRADSLNKLRLINGSEILFMNLKETDEGMVRGLELNSCLVDQAEEVAESMYLFLNARIGRWDQAKVPKELLDENPDWPKFDDGRYKVPNYMLLLCNPDSELHWLYKRYHPESEDFKKKYFKNHQMVQAESTTATLDPELLTEMMENDPVWVDRFVRGKWGIPGGQIHRLDDSSVLTIGKEIDLDFVKKIITRGNLSRVLDHGDFAPTCCLWFSAYQGNHFCYREYYQPDKLISEHRLNITSLSGTEQYTYNLIDPQCAKKTMQKYGGRWSQCDEYGDPNIGEIEVAGKKMPVPTLYWSPADNNELSTRNRISELLSLSPTHKNPVTLLSPASKLYFIQRSEDYPNGCYHSISQLKAQRREKIGTIDGRDYYSDDRDMRVVDHAYDPIRYYCASHALSPLPSKPKVPEGSFLDLRKHMKLLRTTGFSPKFGRMDTR